MAIDFIEIEGYKSLKDVKLELKPINILIGSNGSGKSNFISFFEFLNHLYNQKLQEYIALNGGQEKMLFNGLKVTSSLSAWLSFGAVGYGFNLKAGDEKMIFTQEKYKDNKNTQQIVISFTSEAMKKGFDEEHGKAINGLRKYHFHDTGKKSPFANTSHVENDAYFLYEQGSNLASFLRNIKFNNRIHYARIVKMIQSIAPYFSAFYFPESSSREYVRLQWQSKYGSTIYGVNDLSDGTIRFIALATLFLQPDLPSTIIIDEPELGLHPFAIAKLAGMIKSAAAKKTQVIVATQSSDLINHFEPEDIVTVDQIDGASKFERLDADKLKVWLDEYSVGDLWQKNIISTGQPNR